MSLRYLIRLITAFVVRFKALLLLGILIGIAMFFALNLYKTKITDKNTERIGVSGKYAFESLPTSILNLIGEGLTRIDETGSIEAGLASSWQYSEDGKTWTFSLDENKVWQDGKKVTSDDLKYEFSDARVFRPDEKTIVFTLQNPFSPFPAVVAKSIFKKGLLGTGEWKVVKARTLSGKVEQLTLEDKSGNKKIFKFYPSEERTKLAFKLGQVDIIEKVLSPEPLNKWPNLLIEKEPDYGSFVAVFFNIQDKKLGEKTFRQALNYAIDKEKLSSDRALDSISPLSWAYNPQVKPYNYDLDRAKELYEGVPKELKNDEPIKLITIPILLSVAEKVAVDWEKLGIKTQIQVLSEIPSEYQALIAIYEIPKDPDQYAMWHSTQSSLNITHYQSPRIDKLLEDGRTQLNKEERKKIYLDFQRFLVEDSPAAFLYHPTLYTIKRK